MPVRAAQPLQVGGGAEATDMLELLNVGLTSDGLAPTVPSQCTTSEPLSQQLPLEI